MTTKTEHPILMAGPMVRAILNETKTQTRRVINFELNKLHAHYGGVPLPKKNIRLLGDWPLSNIISFDDNVLKYEFQTDVDDNYRKEIKCPYGVPGDTLWVRESFRVDGIAVMQPDLAGLVSVSYKVDGVILAKQVPATHYDKPSSRPREKYLSGRFMPRWASRINLEVLKIRVERLQEITNNDAWCEGVSKSPEYNCVSMFHEFWDSIYAKRGDGWDKNLWVLVREFKKL